MPRPRVDPNRPATAAEIAIGRMLAIWAHPFIAWRVLSPSGRLIVCSGYAPAAYLVALIVLLIEQPIAF